MVKFINLRGKIFIIILAVIGCVEPYYPPAISELANVLVVDGFINSTESSVTVKMTFASSIVEDSGIERAVTGALVQIEDEADNVYTLNETSNGLYNLMNLNLGMSKKYRLSISTSAHKQYYSEFIRLTSCPSIDSITWKPSIQSPGININVNTHDDSGNTRFYQWTFEETWEYTSRYGASMKKEQGVVLPNDLNVSRCYISKSSTEILVASSDGLVSDAIRNHSLVFIPVRSQKVSHKYSILVKQRALTREAYNFWVQLKKSTESLGSLFDPLPGQVLGNLYSNTDPGEPVLGYFSGGETSEQRIFVHISDLPNELRLSPIINCGVDSMGFAVIQNYPDMFLIGTAGNPPNVYVTSSEKNCMDCRDDGGTLTRPEYWN